MHHSLDVAKVHEIMAKFRPIAPKPAIPASPDGSTKPLATARPCRARRRGRAGLAPRPNKRLRAALTPLLPNHSQLAQFHLFTAQRFSPGLTVLLKTPTDLALPLPYHEREVSPPAEQDLLNKLQEPKVITPQPMRPVVSNITVGCITESSTSSALKAPVSRRPEEVEEEVESEALPAVISDSKNRVRLANSAYKEMVGQPECPWLDSMVESNSGHLGLMMRTRVSSRRINGEVMLELQESLEIPVVAEGFSCRVKIEWACNGRKSFVDAPCDVIRLYCDSKDYLFTWRIHTNGAFETNCRT